MDRSRRKLLLGAGSLVGVGFAGLVGYQFRPTRQAEFPADHLPEDARILVTYASTTGTTASQAAVIAKRLRDAGHRVALAQVDKSLDPGAFDAVVLGSAIRRSQWAPEIVDWSGEHAEKLAQCPTALFQCSMTVAGMLKAGPLNNAQKQELRGDLATLLNAAPNLANSPTAFLPGRIDYDYLPTMIRLGYPFFGGLTLGDHRRPEMAVEAAVAFAARPGVKALLV